jgi:hypothetical protein
MKRFIVSVLCVTVFCIGLGALVERVGARFKSDEKALALIKQARTAIGGDQSIAQVRSMIIKGNTGVRVDFNGESRTELAETEIAMQLPDKMSKKINFRHAAGDGEKFVDEKHDVIIHQEGEVVGDGRQVFVRKMKPGNEEVEKVVVEGKDGEFMTSDGNRIVIRKREGADVEKAVDGDKIRRIRVEHAARGGHGPIRDNQMLRTALSLLLTAPEGMDVNYTFAGEGDVDGTACNIVNAEFGGSNVKLYLSKASSLPVMVSYLGHSPNIMFVRTKEPVAGDPVKDKVMFNHRVPAPAMAEIQIRFSDYRGVNGVQLPHKWTTWVGGQTAEVFDVTAYEINPSNIAEKFQDRKVFVRTKANN